LTPGFVQPFNQHSRINIDNQGVNLMQTSTFSKALYLVLGFAVTGCGGGGGGGSSPGAALPENTNNASSADISSTGTIDGFGSIFVNGVEFETDNSAVSLDGVTATEDKLRLGMVVTVHGTVNEDGTTGTADQVVFDDEVQGPVSAIENGQDGDSLLLTVLGVSIIAERTGTVFDGVSFDTLAVGDLVEVSGFVENGVQLRATRIEKKSDFVPGASEVELKGTVSGLTGTTFTLQTYVVDFSSADLSGVPGGSITEGMLVEVHGTLTNNTIVADQVEQEDDASNGFDDGDELSVQGAISNLVDQGHFEVDGVVVDATHATLEPAGLVLANGVIAEVEGTWNGSILVAEEVKARRGRVELEAKVASVNTAESTLTLQFFTGTVTVQVDSTTLLDDDTDQAEPLTLGDIASGNFLEVEAIRVGAALVASRIRRDEQDDTILQAPVDSFTAGVDITLLGITFSTAGAAFESQGDEDISAETFFGQLQVGDLIKIKDEEVADGVADEVEFEHEDALDGEEFDDDSDDDCTAADGGSDDDDCTTDDDDDSDDDCDSSGSGSDDDCTTDDDEDCTAADGSDDDCATDDGSGDDEPEVEGV
jgi:hypothetical protein